MSVTLAAALDMARRGFRVFPCVPYGKRPVADGWQDTATTDESTIRSWFANRPDINYGVLTNDYVVADVDVSKIGQQAIDNFAELGGTWDTFVVQSPTGGYHVYYAGPDSGLRVGIVPGVDIRSHNGYVVGPGCYTDPARTTDPSVKAEGYYAILTDVELAWVPPGIETRLRAPTERVERGDASVDLDAPTAIANAQVWLLSAPPAIEGQGGDNHTYQVCAKLVRDYALTIPTALNLLLEWNERCVPPWPLEQLLLKVQNAADYGQGLLGGARPEALFGSVVEVPMPLTTWQKKATEHGIYMGNPMDANALEARRWLVKRLMLRGEVTVMAAAGAAGKSITILTMAAHWALGMDYGPYALQAKGVPLRVFIYNAEDDIAEQTRRLLAICITYKLDYEQVRANLMLMDDRNGDLVVASAERNVAHENLSVINFLTETITAHRADIFIGDPLVNMHACSENDNPQMRFVIGGVFKRIARSTNASVLLSHHVGKGGSAERGNADDIRGAGSIINSARVAVMLSGPTDKDLTDLGIDQTQRYSYVRTDDAKANMYLRSGKAIMWTKWESVKIATGDIIGVPVALEVDAAREGERRRVADIIHVALIQRGEGSCSIADAIRFLRAEDEMYNSMCQKNTVALRRLVENTLMAPVYINDKEQLVLTGEKGAPLIRII